MASVPNQNIVEVHKEPCNKNNLYATININAMSLAMKDLTPVQFQVWMYFAKNQAGYVFAVSPAAALAEFGIKKDSFQKAVVVLKEKKYLVPNPAKGSNYFLFHEVPEEEIMMVEKV